MIEEERIIADGWLHMSYARTLYDHDFTGVKANLQNYWLKQKGELPWYAIREQNQWFIHEDYCKEQGWAVKLDNE